MSEKRKKTLQVTYPNGKKIVIPAVHILAIEGDDVSTTVYLPGHAMHLQNPVDQVLAVFETNKAESHQTKLKSPC